MVVIDVGVVYAKSRDVLCIFGYFSGMGWVREVENLNA